MPEFEYRGRDLFEAIEALRAYDDGAGDAGVRAEELRAAIRSHLAGMDEAESEEFDRDLARHLRRYFTEDSLALGLGVADVASFLRWLGDHGYDF